jgi:hypothetical protein
MDRATMISTNIKKATTFDNSNNNSNSNSSDKISSLSSKLKLPIVAKHEPSSSSSTLSS